MGAVEAFDAGFTAQVSVMPPGAKVAPNSKLSEDDAGKAPAVKGHDGYYHGYPWMKSQPNRQTIEYWTGQGSNIGFLASAYPAIDIDIMNPDIARAVEAAVVEAMGPCLVRVGQAPKSLLIFRCDEPLRSFDMHYERWSDLLGAADKHLIQFLGQGRQYVMYGTHPRTMQPYQIHDSACALSLLGPAVLPTLTPEKVVEVFGIINKVMVRFGFNTRSNAEARVHGGEVDQDELKAPSMSDLVSLLERTPNTLPDRDDYVSMGYAVKAASQEDPELGFEAFMDWCQRWDQGANDPEVVRRDWDKMVPPFRMGWQYLLQRCSWLGADVSDFRFGTAEIRPGEAPGQAIEVEADAEVQASQEALQAAAVDADAVLSERWLTQKFIQRHGGDFMVPVGVDTSYCYQWTGRHWEMVVRGVLMDRVGAFLAGHTTMARHLYENEKEGASAAMRLGAYSTIRNVYTMVTSSKAMTPLMDQLDADPDLLDTPAGPIHLPTGEQLKPKKEYMLTKPTTVPMDPTMHCPRWMQFIHEVTQGDAQLAFYLQCLAGYSLTGHTREQVFPFFIGTGGNGKSVFLNVLHDILGDSAVSVPVELFQLSRFGNHEYQLARMHGARLVTTSETKAGGVWDEQRVKQVTGEDKISARHIYGKQFEFNARCTLIVAGNYAPDLEEVTEAMSRRIRVIPWDFKPAEADKMLEEKLRKELPGILAWCVQGAVAWYQHGLPRSNVEREVTAAYLGSQDTLGSWMEDVLQYTGDHWNNFIPNKELYDSYAAWCRADGATPMPSTKFHKRIVGPMRSKGFRRHRTRESRGWAGGVLSAVHAPPPNVVRFPSVAPPPPQR